MIKVNLLDSVTERQSSAAVVEAKVANPAARFWMLGASVFVLLGLAMVFDFYRASPPAVRKAVFAIERAGDIYPEPVAEGGHFHVLRLVTLQAARLRSLAEVDVSIRTKLIDAKREQAERALIERARQTSVVKIDETALEQIEPPPSAPHAPGTP